MSKEIPLPPDHLLSPSNQKVDTGICSRIHEAHYVGIFLFAVGIFILFVPFVLLFLVDFDVLFIFLLVICVPAGIIFGIQGLKEIFPRIRFTSAEIRIRHFPKLFQTILLPLSTVQGIYYYPIAPKSEPYKYQTSSTAIFNELSRHELAVVTKDGREFLLNGSYVENITRIIDYLKDPIHGYATIEIKNQNPKNQLPTADEDPSSLRLENVKVKRFIFK